MLLKHVLIISKRLTPDNSDFEMEQIIKFLLYYFLFYIPENLQYFQAASRAHSKII